MNKELKQKLKDKDKLLLNKESTLSNEINKLKTKIKELEGKNKDNKNKIDKELIDPLSIVDILKIDTSRSIPSLYEIIKNSCCHYPDNFAVYLYRCCDKVYNCSHCHEESQKYPYKKLGKGYCRKCLTFQNIPPSHICVGCVVYA